MHKAVLWVLYFFIYAFLGWLWETVFVSLQKRRWVSRGFLYGPFLPIYGLGAGAILLSTSAWRSQWFGIFIVGMLGATVLELLVGWVLDRKFHIRYWDYRNWPLQWGGYVSLFPSICWGIFAVLLVQKVHPLAAKLVYQIGEEGRNRLVILLVGGLTVDLILSFRGVLRRQRMQKQERLTLPHEGTCLCEINVRS